MVKIIFKRLRTEVNTLSLVVQWSGHRTLNPRTRVRFPVREFFITLFISVLFQFTFYSINLPAPAQPSLLLPVPSTPVPASPTSPSRM